MISKAYVNPIPLRNFVNFSDENQKLWLKFYLPDSHNITGDMNELFFFHKKSSVEFIDPVVCWTCSILSIFIFMVGLVGNAVSFWALKYSMNKGTATFYLRCLALADSLTHLLSNSTVLMTMISRPILPKPLVYSILVQPYACQIRLFMMFVFRGISTYIIVMFSVERCVLVNRPIMIHSRWCTIKYAKRYLIIMILGICLLNIGSFKSFRYEIMARSGSTKKFIHANSSHKPDKLKCRINPTFYHMIVINFIVVTLIPALIILICNYFIIKSLIVREKRQSTLLKDTEKALDEAKLSKKQKKKSDKTNAPPQTPINMTPNTLRKNVTLISQHSEQQIKSKQRIKATKRLCIVSTVFVVLSVPLLITRAQSAFKSFFSHPKPRLPIPLAQKKLLGPMTWTQYAAIAENKTFKANQLAISLVIFFVNFSVNFILYSLTTKEFLNASRAVLTCDKKRILEFEQNRKREKRRLLERQRENEISMRGLDAAVIYKNTVNDSTSDLRKFSTSSSSNLLTRLTRLSLGDKKNDVAVAKAVLPQS